MCKPNPHAVITTYVKDDLLALEEMQKAGKANKNGKGQGHAGGNIAGQASQPRATGTVYSNDTYDPHLGNIVATDPDALFSI